MQAALTSMAAAPCAPMSAATSGAACGLMSSALVVPTRTASTSAGSTPAWARAARAAGGRELVEPLAGRGDVPLAGAGAPGDPLLGHAEPVRDGRVGHDLLRHRHARRRARRSGPPRPGRDAGGPAHGRSPRAARAESGAATTRQPNSTGPGRASLRWGMPPVTDAPQRQARGPARRRRGRGGCASSAPRARPCAWSQARPRPPGPGEARVEVGAVGLNFPDLLLCAGRYQERPPLPFSPGFEAAGVVAEAGRGVRRSPGEQVVVVPELPNGALQQSITVPAAAAVPGAGDDAGERRGGAAHRLPDRARGAAPPCRAAGRGDGAGHRRGRRGGLGRGAAGPGRGRPCIAAVTGPGKAAACRRMGADLVIDLASEPDPVGAGHGPRPAGRAPTSSSTWSAGDTFGWARRCVAFEGRIVLVGFTGGAIGQVPANHVLLRNYSVVGLHLAALPAGEPGAAARGARRAGRAVVGRGRSARRSTASCRSARPRPGWTCWPGGRSIGRVVLRCASPLRRAARPARRRSASRNFCTLPDTVSGSWAAVVTITYAGTLNRASWARQKLITSSGPSLASSAGTTQAQPTSPIRAIRDADHVGLRDVGPPGQAPPPPRSA